MTNTSGTTDYDVVIVGGGPTGLTLAIDLGQRGISCLLVEQNTEPSPWPKFDRCNARTMEYYRRLGLSDRVRELGYPADHPMDVYIVSSMAGPAHAVLRYPSVEECRAQIAACVDGSWPLEPYQLVSQNKTEPMLKSAAEQEPSVVVRFGTEFVEFSEEDDRVRLEIVNGDGTQEKVTAQFLVGCDGARSTVRKQLGVELSGEGRAEVRQVIFTSDDLAERIPVGRGRHYAFLDENGSGIVVQGDRREFTLHTTLPEEADFDGEIARLIGFDVDFTVTNVSTWTPRLLLAEEFSRGRVFIAGDAAHQVIPTGGLGMNTGVGDALNLSWKLAAAVAGWGGPALLDSYAIERKPVAIRNREASRWAAQGVVNWRGLMGPDISITDELIDAVRAGQGRMYSMIGAELGYSYAGSPVIATEGDGPVQWETTSYTPNARPGDRLPHTWVTPSEPLQDLLGPDFTLVDFGADAEPDPLVAVFAKCGVPLKVVRLGTRDDLLAVYQARLVLVRPDLHVSWRGGALPDDVDALVRTVTGN